MSLVRRELQAKLTSLRVDGPQLPIFLLVIVSSRLDWKRRVQVKGRGIPKRLGALHLQWMEEQEQVTLWVRREEEVVHCSPVQGRPRPSGQRRPNRERSEVGPLGGMEVDELSFWFAFFPGGDHVGLACAG